MEQSLEWSENGTERAWGCGDERQYVVIDFSGGSSLSYHNEQLGIHWSGIMMEASSLSAGERAAVLAGLQGQCGGVVFTDTSEGLPAGTYSTIHVGMTDAFAELTGQRGLAGIAETTGAEALAKADDCAFVLMRPGESLSELTAVILHEAGHLTGTLIHDYTGDGLSLDDFCERYGYYTENKTLSFVNVVGYSSEDDGGAVYTIGNLSCTYGFEFMDNHSGGDGGAVYGVGTVIIRNYTISNNSAAGNGGAIALVADGYSSIWGNTFTGNHAGQCGGGVAVLAGSFSVTGSSFDGNSADGLGGAVYAGRDVTKMTLNGMSTLSPSDTIYSCAATTITNNCQFGADFTLEDGNLLTFTNAAMTFVNAEAMTFSAEEYAGIPAVAFTGVGTVHFTTALPVSSVAVDYHYTDTVGERRVLATGISNLSDVSVTINDVRPESLEDGGDSRFEIDGDSLYTYTYLQELLDGGDITDVYFNMDTEVGFDTSQMTIDLGSLKCGGDKRIYGNGVENTSLTGRLHGEYYDLELHDLSYSGHIYGGSRKNSDNDGIDATYYYEGSTLTLDNVRIVPMENGVNSRIYGLGEWHEEDINYKYGTVDSDAVLNIKLTDDSVVNNVYGGYARMHSTAGFTCRSIQVTVDGGTYLDFVGTGTQGRVGCCTTVDFTQLTIRSGVFNHYVYAGLSCQIGVGFQTINGNSNLLITGGTFNNYVFGGAVGSYNEAMRASVITGDVVVMIDSTENDITFNKHIFAGSMAAGKIGGSTTITFTNSNNPNQTSLHFGEQAFVSGGSMYDAEYSDPAKCRNCTGTNTGTPSRTLKFVDYTGDFGGNFRNTYETVSFEGSAVVFTQPKEADLRFVDTWCFDVRDDLVDLTWTDEVANNAFYGDTFVLKGSTNNLRNGEKTIIRGCADSLEGWRQIKAIELGGARYVPYSDSGQDYITFAGGANMNKIITLRVNENYEMKLSYETRY